MRRSASCSASRADPASRGTVAIPHELAETRSVAAQQQAELVAADPVGGVLLPDDGGEPTAEPGEEVVSRGVPERVVVALEAVEVEEDDAQRLGLGRRLAEAVEIDLHRAAAAEPGERIGPDLFQQRAVLAHAHPEPDDHGAHG